jgi:3D (Asp-Asp-Asp) domain-containing protein
LGKKGLARRVAESLTLTSDRRTDSMKSFFGGSVVAAAALLAVSLGFHAPPLAAETLLAEQANRRQEQEPKPVKTSTGQQEKEQTRSAVDDHAEKAMPAATKVAAVPLVAPLVYEATAYSRPGRGASGMGVRAGTIAADPKVLPFGTRVRLDAGQYSGEYLVTDSGTAIKGRKIDVWIPSYSGACRFGRRNVKLMVLSYGGKRRK